MTAATTGEKPSFLAGGGKLGAMMRTMDWSRTPLGPIEAWPQSLQTTVSTCLNCSFPILIWWGPDLVKLYNDAYAEIIAEKHPSALGASGRDVWPEVWDTIGPMLDRVMRHGEAAPADDLMLMLRRRGYPEECYFSFSYSPIRDETGQVAGVFCPVVETTQRVFAERRSRLLLDLEARLRDLTNPYDVKAVASAVLGPMLAAAQVGYAEITSDEQYATIEAEWNNGQLPSTAGRHRLSNYSPQIIADLRQGKVVCIGDVRGDPRTNDPAIVNAYLSQSIAAFLNVPLIRNGRLSAVLFVHHCEPVAWTEHQVLCVREAAERTWGAAERVRAEAALRSSEEEFRTLGENLPNLCWMANADGARYWFNARWFSYTGTDFRQMQGWGWLSIVHPDDQPHVVAHWARAVETGDGFSLTFAIRGRNGLYRPFLTRVVPVRDADGKLTRWFGTNVDIGDLQQIEDRLRASEAKLRELNQNLEAEVAIRTADRDRMWRLSTDVMLVARFDGIITACNPAWTTVFGWGEDDLLRHQFLDLVHPDDLEATVAEVARLVDGHTVHRFVNRYRTRDGGWRWLSWTAVPDVALIHAVGRDITAEQEAAENLERSQDRLRQAQKMEALGQLAGGIAHDFNNVLQAVSGGLSLIQRKAADPEAVRRLATMANDAAARGAAITSRLLAFARADELKAVELHADTLCESIREILAPTLGAGIEVRLDVAPGAPPFLADKAQLETVLINLAVNARDAMPDGGVLTLSARPESVIDSHSHPSGLVPGDYLRLTITDTGLGMDAATLARAGEPFFTTKPLGRGTGLGLAMARGFSQQSGGGLAISSRSGAGTAVHLWFPSAVSSDRGQTDGRFTDGAADTPRGIRIVLVDDDHMVRCVLAAHLEDRGFHVIQASDGLSALATFNAGAVADLLVTDYAMPGMNGLTLIQEVRKRLPYLPALLLTGYADAAARLSFEDTAEVATILLRKPVSADELASCAARLVMSQAVVVI